MVHVPSRGISRMNSATDRGGGPPELLTTRRLHIAWTRVLPQRHMLIGFRISWSPTERTHSRQPRECQDHVRMRERERLCGRDPAEGQPRNLGNGNKSETLLAVASDFSERAISGRSPYLQYTEASAARLQARTRSCVLPPLTTTTTTAP